MLATEVAQAQGVQGVDESDSGHDESQGRTVVASVDQTQWSDGMAGELRERWWFCIVGLVTQHAKVSDTHEMKC